MEEPQLLVHQFRADRIRDALAKDRYREAVGVAGAQVIVRGAKERLVAARRQQRIDRFAEQVEPEDVAITRSTALEQGHRVAPEG